MGKLAITKASGEKDDFSIQKLSESLRRAGADATVEKEVLQQIEPMLYEGISTKKIYQRAFSILKKRSKSTAARYSLKQGIMQLGPSGFPFEKFFAEILKTQGYATQIGVFEMGKCVRHEIDIIAVKDGFTHMIECKFHNLPGTKSDVKTPMYIQSRFRDVEKALPPNHEIETRFHQCWVVTNTRFTDDAARYGSCMAMNLIGWDYPAKGSIRDLVNTYELYPLTCLTTPTHAEKQQLLDSGLVLCKDLLHNRQLLLQAGIVERRIDNIIKEAHGLCGLQLT